MVFFLIRLLEEGFGLHVPAAFTYVSTRMALAALTSLLICIFVGPRFIKKLYEMKIGQPIRMDECPLLGELHKKKKDTPTMGGLLILAAMIVSLLLFADLTSAFTLILLLTTVSMGILGGYDDYLKLKMGNSKGLSGKKKFAIQACFSGLIAIYLLNPGFAELIHHGNWFAPPVASAGVGNLTLAAYTKLLYIPFFKDPIFAFTGLAGLLFIVWTAFVITGTSNAVNLTDGLDGLAAGSLIMVASTIAAVAFLSNHHDLSRYLHILYIEGSGEIAVYLTAFVGACIGFLWYNGYPAQVFMGDTGSLALGGVLGVSAILLRREFLLALVGGVFVAEALSVILQVASYKLRGQRRIFLCAPLHHHFEYKGWPETKVVVRFWIVGLLLAILGLASLKFQ